MSTNFVTQKLSVILVCLPVVNLVSNKKMVFIVLLIMFYGELNMKKICGYLLNASN